MAMKNRRFQNREKTNTKQQHQQTRREAPRPAVDGTAAGVAYVDFRDFEIFHMSSELCGFS
jgi:hypothetical protein